MSDPVLASGIAPLPVVAANAGELPLATLEANAGSGDFQAVLAAQLDAALRGPTAAVDGLAAKDDVSSAKSEGEAQADSGAVQLALENMLAALPAAPGGGAAPAAQQAGAAGQAAAAPLNSAHAGLSLPAGVGTPAERPAPAVAAVVAAAPSGRAAEFAAADRVALPLAQDSAAIATDDPVRVVSAPLNERAPAEAAPQTPAQTAPQAPAIVASERTAELVQRGRELAAPQNAPVRLTSRSFGEDVGNRVLWMASQRQQVAELRIDPPNLGPLEVRLSIDKDQASLTLLSPHGAVRDALQAHLPRLQEMMLTAGLDLTSVYVGADSAGQQQRWARADAQGPAVDYDGMLTASLSGVEVTPARAGLGLVDVYA